MIQSVINFCKKKRRKRRKETGNTNMMFVMTTVYPNYIENNSYQDLSKIIENNCSKTIQTKTKSKIINL